MRYPVTATCLSALCTVFSIALTAQTPPVTKAAAPKPAAPKPAAPAPAAVKPAEPPKPARPNGLYGTMVTTMGTFQFQLFEKEAPISVKNFIDLARGNKAWLDQKTGQMVKRPLLPGTTFHRVIPGFMLQAGDPTGTGAGNVGFNVPDEFNSELRYDRPGRFGMANINRPNTNSSQFFITEVPTPWLDGKHTIFGQVTEGLELIGKIARVPRDASDKPNTPIRIVSLKFDRVGPVPPNAPEGVPPVPKKAAPAPAKKAATPVPAVKKAATPAPPAKKQ